MNLDPKPLQPPRAAATPAPDLAAAPAFDPVAELRALLARLDADIAAGRLSRADAIEVAEYIDDRLHDVVVDLYAHQRRLA